MAQAQLVAKKTKSEILAEYSALLEQYEELKTASRLVYQPQSAEAIAKAKASTADSITKSISELKMTVASGLNQLSSTASDHLTALLNEIFRALATFDELQQAIEISRKQLDVQYKIQVGAEILEQVVNEYEAKKHQLEIDFVEQKTALETEIAIKRRNYERETEEYNYTTKLSRSREQALFEEEKQNKIEQLAARELE
ncbi:MAG: hypothetical protein Q8M83_06815, partial [bacterium]|nr:hypothetical protein [bacterium]